MTVVMHQRKMNTIKSFCRLSQRFNKIKFFSSVVRQLVWEQREISYNHGAINVSYCLQKEEEKGNVPETNLAREP